MTLAAEAARLDRSFTLVDVPASSDEAAVDYVEAQFEALVTRLTEATETHYDPDRLHAAIRLSNQTRALDVEFQSFPRTGQRPFVVDRRSPRLACCFGCSDTPMASPIFGPGATTRPKECCTRTRNKGCRKSVCCGCTWGQTARAKLFRTWKKTWAR